MKTLIKIIFTFALVLSVLLINAGVGGGGVKTDPQCLAGGPGSTTCDYSYTLPAGMGETSCSVTCTAPQYACCYLELAHVKCVCKSSSASQQ